MYSQRIYVSNHEYDLKEIKSTERNFPPLRFSCLYDLKVSGPEIRHLPANHPLACFVLYLKIINILFEKYTLSKELKNSIKLR